MSKSNLKIICKLKKDKEECETEFTINPNNEEGSPIVQTIAGPIYEEIPLYDL